MRNEMVILASLVLLAAYVGLLLVAAATDFFRYLIPNRLVLALLFFFALGATVFFSDIALWRHLVAGGGLLLVGMLAFHFRWLGGGDAKLLAAAALWAGLDALMAQLLYIALAGGALALALSLCRTAPAQILIDRLAGAAGLGVPQPLRPRQLLPYGVAIVAGSLAVIDRIAFFRPLW